MKKFQRMLCIVLGIAMLSGLYIPVMAAETTVAKLLDFTKYETLDNSNLASVVTITENGVPNKVCSPTTTNSQGFFSGTQNATITDSVYEAGYVMKTLPGQNLGTPLMAQLSYDRNYPVLTAQMRCASNGDIESIQIDNTQHKLPEGLWKNADWNSVRFRVTDDKTNQNFSVDLYINSRYVGTYSYAYSANQKADTTRVGYPCNWRIYWYNSISATAYLDNLFIARYREVKNFSQETVYVGVRNGKLSEYPETVSVTADGTTTTMGVVWGEMDEENGVVSGLLNECSVDTPAVANLEIRSISYLEDFEGDYTPGGNHTVVTEANGNKHLQIYKTSDFNNTIAPNMRLNPGTDDFKIGFRFRLPDMTGLIDGSLCPVVQIGADTGGNQIMQIGFDPLQQNGTKPYNRIRVHLYGSADGSLAEQLYSLWVYEHNSNFDWTTWHKLEILFRDGKVAFLLDGDMLSEGIQGDGYHWKNVRTDILFNQIRLAHRTDPAQNIDAITHFDDIFVDTYYDSITESITAEPMSFAINQSSVTATSSNNQSDEFVAIYSGQYLDYTIDTKQDASYLVSLTGGTTAEVPIDVLVNGKKNLSKVKTGNTQAYGTRLPHELGVISLKQGKNVIRFKGYESPIVATEFTLSKARRDETVAINSATVTNSSNITFTENGCDMTAPAYLETQVPVLQDGWYGVKVNAKSAQSYTLRVETDQSATQRDITSCDETYRNSYLGMMYLTAGMHTMKASLISGSVSLSSVTLTEPDVDLFADTQTLSLELDKKTVASMDGVESGDALDDAVTLKSEALVTLKLYAEKALNYALDASYVGATESTVSVTVNGYVQIADAPAQSRIGYINLKRGLNEITVKNSGQNALTIDQISLSLADSFINGKLTMWAQENRVANAVFTGSNGAFSIVAGSHCATMRKDSYVEYDLYNTQPRYAYLTLDAATPDYTFVRLSVDGAIVFEENFDPISEGYSIFETCEAASLVVLPAGYCTLRYIQAKDAAILRSFTLTEATDDETVLTGFSLQMENGVRAPYVIRDGFTGYGVADIVKIGNPTDNYSLVIAQYKENGQLVGVNLKEINVAEMPSRSASEVRVPLTYQGNGGEVKVFLVNETTLAPKTQALLYDEPSYFPDTLFDEVIIYTDATNVKNKDDVYYADYSLHNDQYDIDAIFYDSPVGNQTKVFAYIGVPKGATEENPVPAVVCVHGGGGVAYIDWVKKWNDNGYAAIAMALSGDGPATVNGEAGTDPTLYKGVECWGNHAFVEGTDASMYQNVTNVIRAHNLLRQWPGVDETKTGITGISWGGVTTTITMGADNRFRFAIPVYGGGYLDLDETYFAAYIKQPNSTLKWDPANFAAKSEMPVLFINGDSDHSFSLNTTSLTKSVTPNARLSVRHNFSHSHTSGWEPQEIYTFANAVLNGYDPFIAITAQSVENGEFTVGYQVPQNTAFEKAEFYYITDERLPYGGGENISWKKVSLYTPGASSVTFTIPEDATMGYVTLYDTDANRISTEFMTFQ